jgi:excinuclease UvrABC nuclease subunit
VAAKTISLSFDGYWRDVNSNGVPNEPGIYLVYVCTYNAQPKTVTLHRLIYIGEAAKVRDRIQNHEKRPIWARYLAQGNELCYSFAPITSPDRERAEAALIFHHKPPVNTDYKDSFPFEETTVNSSGKCEHIAPSFTVQRTT